MSSVINNSNANSALVNTIQASESMTMASVVYSTEPIAPLHSMQYLPVDKASGSVSTNGQMHFQIPKYGTMSQCLLSYDITLAGAGKIKPLDFCNRIKSIDLLSSSRTISTLTRADLVAQFSDLKQSQYNPVSASCIGKRTVAAGALTQRFTIPLVFGLFKEQNTQINTSFNEPCQIRVNWDTPDKAVDDGASPPVAVAATMGTNPQLKIRYKTYPEAAVSQMLAENYGDRPELNMLSTRWYDESTKTHPQAGAAGSTQSTTVELRNTEVVSDFFVYIRPSVVAANAVAATLGEVNEFLPCEITKLTLRASGQDIVELTGEELAFMRLDTEGYACSLEYATVEGLTKVGKVQTGVYDEHGVSNGFSLREMNSVSMAVEFTAPAGTAANDTYEIVVAERCLAIYAVSSSTGRLTLSLAN